MLQLKFSRRPPALYRNNPDLYKEIPTYKYETQTDKFITSSPLLMDPLERANIRIGASSIPGITGDALIARRDIPAFAVVVYYAGVLLIDTKVSSYSLSYPFAPLYYQYDLRMLIIYHFVGVKQSSFFVSVIELEIDYPFKL